MHVHLLNFLMVGLIWQSWEMDVHSFTYFHGFNSFSRDIMVDYIYLSCVLYCVHFEVINTGYICYKLD